MALDSERSVLGECGVVLSILTLCACSAVIDNDPPGGKGGATRDGGAHVTAGSGGAPATSGPSGTAGSNQPEASAGAPGTGGSSRTDASDASIGTSEDAGTARDAARTDSSPSDGGVIVTDSGDIGPIVAPDCPGDPRDGWTEYQDKFHLEYPYNLQPTDRYTFIDGVYTYWIFPNDKPHAVGNTTAPRIETHYTVFKTGQKMWTADVMVESPSQNTVIFQVHTSATGAGPVYLRIVSGNLEEIDGSVLARGLYDKWFNLKVAFDAATSSAVIYINNCQKLSLRNSRPGNRDFYFKNGVYTCESSICRDHFKNIHLYEK
jgi:hypothetical protein